MAELLGAYKRISANEHHVRRGDDKGVDGKCGRYASFQSSRANKIGTGSVQERVQYKNECKSSDTYGGDIGIDTEKEEQCLTLS